MAWCVEGIRGAPVLGVLLIAGTAIKQDLSIGSQIYTVMYTIMLSWGHQVEKCLVNLNNTT